MKKNLTKIALFTVSAMALFSSCDNSKYPGYEMTEDGLYYKFHKHNEDGKKPQIGGVVHVIMSYKNNKDSVLFDSKSPQFNRTGDGIIYFPLLEPEFKGGLEQGILMMSIGDSASFIISADSLFVGHENERPPFIEKGSNLTFDVCLKKYETKEEVEIAQRKQREEMLAMMEMQKNEEPKIIAKYLEEKKIKVKPTDKGLYFIESKKGKGAAPKKGELVKVHYTGRLLDGTVFDSSIERGTPYEFPLGTQNIIEGWNEGIGMMKAGGKAQLIIPSQLGYGTQGNPPAIPPFATLVFDVELVSISPAK